MKDLENYWLVSLFHLSDATEKCLCAHVKTKVRPWLFTEGKRWQTKTSREWRQQGGWLSDCVSDLHFFSLLFPTVSNSTWLSSCSLFKSPPPLLWDVNLSIFFFFFLFKLANQSLITNQWCMEMRFWPIYWFECMKQSSINTQITDALSQVAGRAHPRNLSWLLCWSIGHFCGSFCVVLSMCTGDGISKKEE